MTVFFIFRLSIDDMIKNVWSMVNNKNLGRLLDLKIQGEKRFED
jgi:hypothetical protein